MDRKREERSSSDHRRHSGNDELPNLYAIFKGEIASVQAYGIFVKIPGFDKQGLVHKSQMSSTRIENPEEMVEKGETVYCKVINIDKETGKVALSMKVVNQATGEDRDPNQIQTSLDEQRRRTGVIRGHQAIQLGAIYDTNCRKCGGRGHLSQDCFGQKDGPVYELLPDNEDGEDKAASSSSKSKKEKKKKKKKKKKSKHKDNSDDSGSESDSDSAKKHHKKKKKKKHKKRHSSSDSSSDSDSDVQEKKAARRRSHSESKNTKEERQSHHHRHRRDSSSERNLPLKHHKRKSSLSEPDSPHKHRKKSKS